MSVRSAVAPLRRRDFRLLFIAQPIPDVCAQIAQAAPARQGHRPHGATRPLALAVRGFPAGGGPWWRSPGACSSAERGRSGFSAATVRMRLESCQRQSFHSRVGVPG